MVEMGKSTPPCRTLRSLRGKILISDNVYCLKSFSYVKSLSLPNPYRSLLQKWPVNAGAATIWRGATATDPDAAFGDVIN